MDAKSLAERLIASADLDEADLAQLRPGVEAVTEALARQPGLTEQGRGRAVGLFEDAIRRLNAITADRRKYPEIAEVEVSPPLFILGLPRCGTSILHAMMGADPATRTPLMWEVAAPSPPPEAATFDTDPRADAFDHFVDAEFVGEYADVRKAHPIGARVPQECTQILQTAFRGLDAVMLYQLPSYFQWYLGADSTWAYQVHKRWLQHLQWRNPRQRWVLKVQEHMYHLPELLSVYPDAVFVQPHRDPTTVMASISRLIQVLRGISFADQDPAALGEEMLHLWHEGQVRMMAYRKAQPDLPVYDMRYKDISADPVAAVRGVYDHYRMDFTAQAESGVRRWLAENPADKHGRHAYQLADFGLTDAKVRDVYADYIETYRDYL